MATAEEVLRTLQSIDTNIKALLEHLGAGVKPASAPTIAAIAPDSDLDGKYGNEKIRFMPRDWSGDSFVSRTMNECPPALLDMLAESFDYFAQKNDASGEKTDKGVLKSTYDRRSASRARGWAARLRGGWKPAAEPARADGDAPLTDDDIPFMWLLPMLVAAHAALGLMV